MPLPGWHTLAALSFPTNLLDRLAASVTVVLVFVLAHTLAHLTWSLWPEPVSPPPPPRSIVAQSTAARGPDTGLITRAHLFGKVDATRPAPALIPTAAPAAVPETQLKLTLRGIIAAVPPDGGAIIAEAGGSDHFFRVGDPLPGGAVLQEIQPNQVLLARNHRLETLRLPKNPGSGSINITTDTAPADESVDATDAVDTDTTDTTGTTEAPEEPAVEEDSAQVLSRYREQILENPARLLSLIQTQPVYRAGRLEGFLLRPGQEGGDLLERYGLKPNDLVTSLNDIPLDNPLKAVEVLRGLRNAPTLTLGVSRQGRTENITLRFAR
ncbi:general secretion pathway protein C [Gammaproteobacteria bacterium]